MSKKPHNFINLEGQVFDRLTVTPFSESRVTSSGKSVRYWLCQCVCGGEIFVSTYSLRAGKTKSCGCLQKERTSDANTKHNSLSKRLRKTYGDILQRCYNNKDSAYPHYGGRGIKVCDRWLQSFENFYNDVVETYEEGLSIDRVDTNGDYSPHNFRWADRTTQAFNRNSFGVSKYRGVSKGYKGKWKARVILEGGEEVYLGQYTTQEGAAKAYNEYVKKNKLPNVLNKLEYWEDKHDK